MPLLQATDPVHLPSLGPFVFRDLEDRAASSAPSSHHGEENHWALYVQRQQSNNVPVWNVETITDRLTNLPHGGPEHPPNYAINPAEPDTFVENIRSYARENVAGELMDSRVALYESLGQTPEHLYLRGKTKQTSLHFEHYIKFIQEDLGCDDNACSAFVTLFSTSPPEAPHGYMEACRILAHCLKDKHKDQHQNENMSRFLQKACEEAIEALNHYDKAKDLYKKRSS